MHDCAVMKTLMLAALLFAACGPAAELGPPPCDCPVDLVCNPVSDQCRCPSWSSPGATAASSGGYACNGSYREFPACADLGCEDAELCEHGADTCLCYVPEDDHAYRCEP